MSHRYRLMTRVRRQKLYGHGGVMMTNRRTWLTKKEN